MNFQENNRHSFVTIWAAKADFLNAEVGSIDVGKNADFTILDKDIMTAPDSQLLSTKVLATYSGGRSVYNLGW